MWNKLKKIVGNLRRGSKSPDASGTANEPSRKDVPELKTGIIRQEPVEQHYVYAVGFGHGTSQLLTDSPVLTGYPAAIGISARRDFRSELRRFQKLSQGHGGSQPPVETAYFEFACPKCGKMIGADFDEMAMLAGIENFDDARCIACYAINLN